MRFLPRSPYVAAILFAGVTIVAAWVNRDNIQPVSPGTPAPDFEAVTLKGEPASLQDYAGEVILLNIWATWCAPCREEMPSMEALYRDFKEKGEDFEIVAVSIDRETGETDAYGNAGGDLVAFAEELGLTFEILHDPSGEIQGIYQTTGVPESFVIGRDGTLYRHLAGATNWDTDAWRAAIQRLLDGETEPEAAGHGG